MLICFTFAICFCPFWGALPFPFLSVPLDKLFLGLNLPFCGTLPLVRWGGVSQWSTVLWLFLPNLSQWLVYLFICANLWIRNPDVTVLVRALCHDSSSMTLTMIFCKLYFVISLIDVRYCDVRSWYDDGREEQNINVAMSSDSCE